MPPKEKDDSAEVEFIATVRNDGKMYSLTVLCDFGLTDQEFGDCLIAFAQDIRQGKFIFDDAPGSTEISSQ